jgi:hypothetical protein
MVEPTREISFAGFISVSIHATFLTSAWFVFYLAADVATRFITWFDKSRGFIDRHFVLDEHPVAVMVWLLFAPIMVCFLGYCTISWAVAADPVTR